MIKRGVSLYSYQQEYYLGKMTLEDCVKAVRDLGTDGVEIISEAMIPNFPNPDEKFINQWFELMDKYHTKPICYDAFMDGWIHRDRVLTDDEAVEMMVRDIKLASRMGFKIIRVLCAVPLKIIERSLPYAEKYNVKLGLEVHSPFKLATPWLDNYIEFSEKSGSEYFGIIPDFGIFVKKPVKILEDKHLRRGATQKIVEYVRAAYISGQDKDQTFREVQSMNPTSEDLFWAKEAFDYTYCDPQLLADYIPYILHIHGKVYEMTLHCEEPSIPYADIVSVLVKNNWNGYINTEYEGQRHYHDIPDMDIDSVEQVRRHHVMLKRLLNE
jgi:sugar phosphate isomerase/epimerase